MVATIYEIEDQLFDELRRHKEPEEQLDLWIEGGVIFAVGFFCLIDPLRWSKGFDIRWQLVPFLIAVAILGGWSTYAGRRLEEVREEGR